MNRKKDKMPAILLIGPQLDAGESDTNVIGGNKLMVAEQVRELGLRGFDVDVINTAGGVTNLSPWKIRAIRFARFLRVAWGAARKLRHFDVVFLIIASYSAISLGSFFWLVCKITGKSLVLRITGGDLKEDYQRYGALTRWLADRLYMRSSLVYVETQELCRSFNSPPNFRWFPNTRDIQAPKTVGREKVHKLIFVARLEMDKGLAETLDACHHLPKNCYLNVFGPRMSGTNMSLFNNHPRATYGGVLDPAEMPRVMSEHDLLVYPSYYRSEGYPGSILEAFQCGLPVVAAKWGGIPELVEHEENGLLVEPRSAAEIQSAIERLLDDTQLYQRLCEGAKRRGEHFRSSNWYDRMALDLQSLCRKQAAG